VQGITLWDGLGRDRLPDREAVLAHDLLRYLCAEPTPPRAGAHSDSASSSIRRQCLRYDP